MLCHRKALRQPPASLRMALLPVTQHRNYNPTYPTVLSRRSRAARLSISSDAPPLGLWSAGAGSRFQSARSKRELAPALHSPFPPAHLPPCAFAQCRAARLRVELRRHRPSAARRFTDCGGGQCHRSDTRSPRRSFHRHPQTAPETTSSGMTRTERHRRQAVRG